MAKRLSDISLQIAGAGDAFKNHLQKSLDVEIMSLLNELSKLTDIYIFSGIIRNFFLKVPGFRDIDLVLRDKVNVEDIFKDCIIKRNSYGGYKINKNHTVIDLWYLDNTWAFKHQPNFDFALKELIPSTAFFNFSAVIYSYNENRFYASNKFRQFLRDKHIDLVYEPNANQRLCIINTFYYQDKLQLKVSPKMKRHVVGLYRSMQQAEYQSVQEKHFGRVLYTPEQIENKIEEYSKSLQQVKNRRKRSSQMFTSLL